MHFNSHAHVERDYKIVTIYCGSIISTHTLTWSVTRSRSKTLWKRAYFNSHAHVERDKAVYLYDEWILCISTHTLTWSVTISAGVKIVNIFISTHTLTWSVTSCVRGVFHVLTFKLTRSRGAWPMGSACVAEFFNFNSHAHVERDA